MRKIDDVQVQLVGVRGGCYQDASATLVDGLLLDGVIQSDGRKELGLTQMENEVQHVNISTFL